MYALRFEQEKPSLFQRARSKNYKTRETLKTKILPQVKNPLLVDSVKLFDVSDN